MKRKNEIEALIKQGLDERQIIYKPLNIQFLLEQILKDHQQEYLLFLDERKEQLAGIFIGIIGKEMLNDDLILEELFFYVLPEFRKTRSAYDLFQKIETEARQRNIKKINFSAQPEHAPILAKRGYRHLYSTMSKSMGE